MVGDCFRAGLLAFYERIIFAGEQYLRRKFGEAYDTWLSG
jgi:hypothetical protein